VRGEDAEAVGSGVVGAFRAGLGKCGGRQKDGREVCCEKRTGIPKRACTFMECQQRHPFKQPDLTAGERLYFCFDFGNP